MAGFKHLKDDLYTIKYKWTLDDLMDSLEYIEVVEAYQKEAEKQAERERS